MLSGKQGILPIQDLREAITRGAIASAGDPIPQANLQPASLDLRLGGIAHRLRCSFLPQGRSVSDRLEEIAMDSMYLDQEGTVLEVNRPYLIPLTETLNLPPDIRARANPRSSTGRLDIFTRVITNDGNRFDDIAAGYQGPMYLEIVSRSYTVRVHQGQSLNQIRLIRGNPKLSSAEILDSHQSDPLALLDGQPCRFQPEDLDHGLPLSVDLLGKGDGIAGYRVRRNSRLLDLSLIGEHRTEEFWEPIHAEDGLKMILEPEEFYLLASLETVRIPRAWPRRWSRWTRRAGSFAPTTRGSSTRASATTPRAPGLSWKCGPTTCPSCWSTGSGSVDWSSSACCGLPTYSTAGTRDPATRGRDYS